MYGQVGLWLVVVAGTFGCVRTLTCYKCSTADLGCRVTASDTPTEACEGHCMTRIQWKFKDDPITEVNISRSCESTCQSRNYLYGYFDSVEDFCCTDELCNSHTKPSKYQKCHRCDGDGDNSCMKKDFVKLSPDVESKIFCAGKCSKVVLDGKEDGVKKRGTIRSCLPNCVAGESPLRDAHQDEEIGTIMTSCCDDKDMCNSGPISKPALSIMILIIVAMVIITDW